VDEVAWLVAHRPGGGRCPAGTGLTLVPLTALRVLRAPPPVTRIDLVWGTRPLATSAMVDRLTCTGLGGCASDPQDRRRVQPSIADRAKPIVGGINLGTARRLSTVVNGVSSQGLPRPYRRVQGPRTTIRCAANETTSSVTSSLLATSIHRKVDKMAIEGDTAQYEVMIEGETHLWAEDSISVTDIRKLGNLPADAPIVEQNLRDGTERTLTEDEVLRPGKLKEGERLTKKRVNFRKE
jgi:hypothetical protein